MTFSAQPRKPRPPLDEAGLFDYAVRSLGRMMRTEAELHRLMEKRIEPGAAAEATMARVIVRLREYGYLNDTVFAETYTRLRQENEKFGQRRVRQSLSQKGVPQQIIGDVIEARYGNTNEETLAREHLERKRIKKPENEKETARVMRRLIAAGFSPSTVYKILRQWDLPEETLAALESVDEDSPAE